MSNQIQISEERGVNAHVESYLDYYCGLDNGPGFAVLLKGDWGVGKTWFIKDYFQRSKSRLGEPIYISFYGVSTLSQVEDKFFEVLHPLLSSKPAKLAGIVLRGLVKTTIQVDLNADKKNDGSYSLQIPDIPLPEYLNNVEERIIVFDDLERCNLDVEEMFGCINSFVEGQNSKVIILLNEDKIEDLKSKKYKTVKEKIIGQTLSIQFDLHSAIQPFANDLTSETAKRSLLSNAHIIEEVYAISGYRNLRSLKQIVLNFERIFNVLPDEAKAIPDLVESLLKSLVALTIDVKEGILQPSDIDNLVEQNTKRMVARTLPSLHKFTDQEKLEESQPSFFERYNFFFSRSLFPGEGWWKVFFNEGILDVEELRISFENSAHFQSANIPDWKKLWHFSDLSEDEFRYLLPRVAAAFEKKELANIFVVKHVFGILLKLTYAELYSKSPEQLIKAGKEYIEYLINDAYSNGLEDFFASADLLTELLGHVSSDMGAFSLSYQGHDYKEFKEFESYAREYGAITKEKHLPSIANKLLTLMSSDTQKVKRILCLSNYSNDKTKSYFNVPVLQYMDVDQFVSTLVSIPDESRWVICYALKERYRIINHGLNDELAWITSFKYKLAQEADSRRKTILGYCLARINADLDELVKCPIKETVGAET